ncbi:malectin domain-containing carbohydrate-binding protein [Stakelama saccharophila]|uniref:Malectin domain-containing carbohydrate-binding protein n=1 Tax=Stakelama saccharophila TaxID=3075605 RepID=A0ABZ0B5D5_9SPHN|nr:malectin domain-containing carbohydrate-binding protein [Stakelama sp. W311]WNO52381.1 malectin domain-containing carbohydrate-binding protein [Stakelama sp. W311]
MELVSPLRRIVAVAIALATLALSITAQARSDHTVAGDWQSALFETGPEGKASPKADAPFQQPGFDDSGWTRVNVPHNWQGYAYDRQVRNGSRHGSAWYRKHLTIAAPGRNERIFLMFEGVGAYATVWLNGKPVGRHGGGLVSFRLDVTEAVRGGDNLLAVRVDMPKGITDLPWAPGDDQPESGFSEGSQPFGIFRPVHVVRTAALHIRPFGIYAWGDSGAIDAGRARLTARTEVENGSNRVRDFTIVTRMIAPDGSVAAEARADHRLAAGAHGSFDAPLPTIRDPELWSPKRPTLYTLRAAIVADGKTIDMLDTPYGIRTVEIRRDEKGHRRLFVNDKQFALRGTAEYEHLLGNSFAFSPEQVAARVAQVEAAGFNAFRDAHYPHNFRYGEAIARDGLMWWPQFSAHNWFDNPAYRANFKALLAQWVRERRNNPAVFLWGLQNESQLPKAFAEQAMAIIRELDPTASKQRLVVTCNGGEGADWNVPQNWSGTYGGDPDRYAEELSEQGLVAEYGAWRSLGLHREPAEDGDLWTEGRMAALEQKKARLADSVADRTVGQFQWLLTTHENPGRPMRADGTQIFDGIRPLDHIGPANNKGLMTLWGEPLDVYYMFRARQVPASVAPMVYIVSHTWPDRWTGPGMKSGIEVYSNCDTVELFNDAGGRISLGRKRRDAEQRFVWNDVPVRYDILSAHCYVGGKLAARDVVTLNNLPPAPDAGHLIKDRTAITAAEPGQHYLYRVNVGGKAFTDADGHRWAGDRHFVQGGKWGWTSWADAWPDIAPALGSRRLTHDPIEGAREQALFQSFRYGRDQLRYRFAVPDGRYRVALYFVEPWYGRAGIDARGWRVFDVAVNGRTVLRDLDLFAESGFGHAVRKVVEADVAGGWLTLSFPRVASGQAILSGVAISRADTGEPRAPEPGTDLIADATTGVATRYLDNGDAMFARGNARWTQLPYQLLDQDFVQPRGRDARGSGELRLRVKSDLYLALPERAAAPEGWTDSDFHALAATVAGARTIRSRYRFVTRRADKGDRVAVPANAPVIAVRALPSPYAPGNFSFSKDEGLHQAEADDARRSNADTASVEQGYGGQGYAAMHAGPAAITWPVKSGIAGKLGVRLRYMLVEGAAPRDAVLTVRDSSDIVVATVKLQLHGGEGWREVEAATNSAINAGSYSVRLAVEDGRGLLVDSITID